MLLFLEKVFDNYLAGTQNVYTEDGHADLLGSVDSVFFVVVTSAVSGTTPTLTVQVENSPNGSRWLAEAQGPSQVNNQPIGAGTTFMFRSDLIGSATMNAMPGLRRLRLQLGGTSPAANVIVFASGRDSL